MKRRITLREKYGPAMAITEQAEADRYFEECVQHMMTHGHSRNEAEAIERSNLGYFAGYYNNETRARVEKLFKCSHPVFGSIERQGTPSAKAAFQHGLHLGKQLISPHKD